MQNNLILKGKKIRLVHLLLKDDSSPERQIKSISSLEPLKNYGIEYIQIWNTRWKEAPPRETFARPGQYDLIPIRPAHYGCFRSFADATLEYFSEDLDAFIICEGDAYLTQSHEDTILKIEEALEACSALDINYFSLGSRFLLEDGSLISNTISSHQNIRLVDKVIGCQMLLFPQKIRKFLINQYKTQPWDGTDLFLNNIFCGKFNIGMFEDPVSLQEDGVSVIDEYFKKFKVSAQDSANQKIKLLFLAPHLSTGGMPSYLLKQIEGLAQYPERFEIFVVEYSDLGPAYVVQKNKIKEIIDPQNFWTLGQDKGQLLEIIKENGINIVHSHEMVEDFTTQEVRDSLYSKNRTWKMVETCHNIWFNPDLQKEYEPEAYAFCTPWHKEVSFKGATCYSEVLEFPIDSVEVTADCKNQAKLELGLALSRPQVINVGLWTPGKNQAEGLELARLLPEVDFNFIGNQASNFEQYWAPLMKDLPSNVKVWGERSDVSKFLEAADLFMFNSTVECNPLAIREAIAYKLKIIARQLPQYMDMFTEYFDGISENVQETADLVVGLLKSTKQYTVPDRLSSRAFSENLVNFYSRVKENIKIEKKERAPVKILFSFILGPKVEILGKSENSWNVEFIDSSSDRVIYQTVIKSNHWAKCNRQYYTDWKIRVTEVETGKVTEHRLDLKEKPILISIESSSLGDTLAWFPYLEEFRKKHGCRLIVSTFKNKLFEKCYSNIEFINPGNQIHGLYAKYSIGWFYHENEPDLSKNPRNFRVIPLPQTASDILGLPETIIKPQLDFPALKRPLFEPYVCIAIHSTAQAKYWNNPTGWQELTNYFLKNGKHVIVISREGDGYMGNAYPVGVTVIPEKSMESTINYLVHSEMFIGISSGLSWLAWSLNVPTVIISGFTWPVTEPSGKNVVRVTSPASCTGCFNRKRLDAGDWNWCPDQKGTDRQFECSKLITSNQVILKIEEFLQKFTKPVEADSNCMKIEVSIGEIVDKLAILQIKKNNILDPVKLDNVIGEFDYLSQIVFDELRIDREDLLNLIIINEKLWEIEDAIREKERAGEFDDGFIDLARSVYKTNDIRAEMKKNLNIKYGSRFIEEKSYTEYR